MSRSKGGNRQKQPPAQDTTFVAHVYEDDYREIQKLVQQYPNIETGGDLFGLWQNDSTVIIQLFIGPGKKCERTTTSFHQDIEYLRKVGSVITTEDGLCNVGEWHSHHQIGMPEPSRADCRTVFSNMPQLGLERFVLFIASIESSAKGGKSQKRTRDVKLDQIVLRPFLFVGSKQEIVRGEIELIPGSKSSNPHSFNSRALREIKKGAEPPPAEFTKRKGSTSSEEHSSRTPPKPDKKQGETGQQPPQFSRETKPSKASETELPAAYKDDKSLGRKDDQQHKVQDQKADKNRGGRDDNSENRSPNSSQAPPTRSGGSQHPTGIPPTSPTNNPPSSRTTEPLGPGYQGSIPPTTSPPSPSLWQAWNNAPQPHGASQGQGYGIQGNVTQPPYIPTTTQMSLMDTTPHPSTTQQRQRYPSGNTRTSGHTRSQDQQYSNSMQQRNQGSATGQSHGQERIPAESHATQHTRQAPKTDRSGVVEVGKINGKGYF